MTEMFPETLSPADQAAKLQSFINKFRKVHRIRGHWACTKCHEDIQKTVDNPIELEKCTVCPAPVKVVQLICLDCNSHLDPTSPGWFQCACGSRHWPKQTRT